ncbi:hypothetical protein NC99_09490 [Sunxiuqinia dokdonensis]|uniref:Uncharacterized protein n=1 Tax=Sunxiuqinia dokdonensis TaxID=1409788 RepID=A0A0L8VCP4_9BACT|nr:hypothetical protein NC99_09490 [Sunxiuqinia dokdonensis]
MGDKCIFTEFLFLLCVEIVVFYKGLNFIIFHEHIVFFAAITGIGNDCLGCATVALLPAFKKRDHRERIGWVCEKIKMCNKLVFGTDLQVVGRFQLPVLHVVIFHPHEGGRWVSFGITVPATQGFKVVFIFLQFWQMLFFQRFYRSFLLFRKVFTVDLGNTHFQFIGINWRGRFIIRKIVLRNAFIYHFQYLPDFFLQFGLVLFNRLSPNKSVTVSTRFHFGAINVNCLQTDVPHFGQHQHYLRKQMIDRTFQMQRTKVVDGPEIRPLIARKPHVMDIFFQLFPDFAAGIDVVHVGVKQHFQHHPRVVGRCASA